MRDHWAGSLVQSHALYFKPCYNLTIHKAVMCILQRFDARFTVQCFCKPGVGWAWSWVYWKRAAEGCQYKDIPGRVGEEDALVHCLQQRSRNGLPRSQVLKIGDWFSQALKLDTCSGFTTLAAEGFFDIPSWMVEQTYGEQTLSTLEQLYSLHIDHHQCAMTRPPWAPGPRLYCKS